ncbi:thiol oxidoreductase [Bradymonadaceae bacterium TMQ3]|nr:thiol oxidoreductase [Bradymonadaceae bacterium TMQ3]TXC74885.1 thiol oxidoreductase [Bradymonadales bacterium TMQ1]
MRLSFFVSALLLAGGASAACASPEVEHLPHDVDVEDSSDDVDAAADPGWGDADVNTTDADRPLEEADWIVALFDEGAPLGGPLTSAPGVNFAFLEIADAIPVELTQNFSVGRELFMADWDPAPGPRAVLDGLGPHFHETSCVGCHPTSAGRPPTLLDDGDVAPGLLIRLRRPDDGHWVGDPHYGEQFQPRALAGVAPEGAVHWQPHPDDRGLISPEIVLTTSEDAPTLHSETRASARNSPQIVGMGLLEAIADDDLRALANAQSEGGRVSGRVHVRPDGRVGRFGWKSLHTTVLAQSAAAFAEDIGITSALHPEESCTPTQLDCLDAPSGGASELADSGLEAVAEFQRYVGVPAFRATTDDAQARQGARHFDAIGCADCHTPRQHTSPDAAELLASQAFFPFTDLLLHDMGPELADAVGEGDATPSEWRTPPLWGLGLVLQRSDDARLLHDGRATTFDEAIRWHGGEGLDARQRYEALSPAEQEALVHFLEQL